MNYDFPVKLVPIYTAEVAGVKPILKKKAVMREDTGGVLGVVSDNYALLPHADVVEGFRKVLGNSEYQEKIQVTKGGARLFYTVKIPSVQVEVRPGDFVSLQIIAQNSYDGSNNFSVMFGAFRLVCSNGMIIGKRFVNLRARHIGARMSVHVEDLQKHVGALTDQFKESLPAMQKMTQVSAKDMFDPKELGLPAYIAKQAENDFHHQTDMSVWGWYNAFTAAITHNMKKESPQLAIEYGRKVWDTALQLTK